MNVFADTPRLQLFRLAGIPVCVDVTFVLVPLFLFGVLQQAPLATAVPAFVAVIAGVFLSILLHEIGHATLARLFGVPMGEILVGGFYGYARMLEQPASTAANVTILIAGPLANGLLFLLFWRLLGYPGIDYSGYFHDLAPTAAIAGTGWLIYAVLMLARINLAMLIFNLLPAFPLDGGRIYRDLLAAVGPRALAAKVIAVLGVAVGLWSVYIGIRTSIVLLLIGAEIAIINWSILKKPAEAEQM